jgi:hypothetical protein
VTYREFIARHPEFANIPEFIVGENGNRIALMDATYRDFTHYRGVLERRISFGERRAREARRHRAQPRRF